MKLKWFVGLKTLKEIRTKYIKLANLYHPDKGGDETVMKEINNEFDYCKIFFKNSFADNNTTTSRDTDFFDDEALQEVLKIIAGLSGLEIELCGSWLWISGDTRPHKATLKRAGCFWASKKMKWYWHPKEERAGHSRGKATIEYIRDKYGSTIIAKNKKKCLSTEK